MRRTALAALSLVAAQPTAAWGGTLLGEDADACTSIGSAVILAHVEGLKDRTGRLKLELWSADGDFLKDDRVLRREGHFFRRVWAETPPTGSVDMCIRTPGPGRYALLFTHDRDGRNKFNFWEDGAGLPFAEKLGMHRPTLEQASITVGESVTMVTIRVQYLRDLFNGFGPITG